MTVGGGDGHGGGADQGDPDRAQGGHTAEGIGRVGAEPPSPGAVRGDGGRVRLDRLSGDGGQPGDGQVAGREEQRHGDHAVGVGADPT